MSNVLQKVAFLDRDGTLIYEPPDTKQVDSLEKLRVLPGVISVLNRLSEQGFMLVMVSNQDGMGTDTFPRADFELVQQKLLNDLKENGIVFARVFICPHFETDNCICRKPKTGLLKEFLASIWIDMEQSFVLGDSLSDAELAQNIGIPFYAVQTNSIFPNIL